MCLKAREQRARAIFEPGKRRERRRRHARHGSIETTHVANEVVAVPIRHADVADDDVRAESFVEQAQGRTRRPGGGHHRAGVTEQPGDDLAGVLLVVDDEHMQARQQRAEGPRGQIHGRRRGLR